MLQGKKLKVVSLSIFKSSFCKAKFGFGKVRISSSASIVAMYSIISREIDTPKNYLSKMP